MRRRVLTGLVVVVAVVATLAGVGADRSPVQAAVTASERRCGNETGQVRLTFDDAGDPARVTALLDVLAERQVRAGFFLVGRWASTHPALVARMRADGHWLGNHTASHADLARLSDGAIRDEIDGGVRAALLRPPYGSVSARVRAVAADAGYRLCLWDVDTLDWRGRSADEIQRTVWSGLRPGAIVLLHLHGRHTLEALPALIDGIRERGYALDPLTRFAGGTVDPASGQGLLLRRDGTVVAGERVVDAGTVTGGDAVAVAARGGGLAGRWVVESGRAQQVSVLVELRAGWARPSTG
jgi:peptidoglycan/xylan/chitin deacetylase (PgdA/CDA1 family)